MTKIQQTKTAAEVKILTKTLIHEGFCHLESYLMQHQDFHQQWTEPYQREILIKPPVAAALPHDPVRDQVVLVEQLRPGAWHNNPTPWLIELVAGIMDHDSRETLEELIHREMLEETGLQILALEPIYHYLVTPGCSTEKVKLYYAQVDATQALEFGGLSAEHEDLKIHVISTQEAFAAVRTGQINNAATIIALQWLELNLTALKNHGYLLHR